MTTRGVGGRPSASWLVLIGPILAVLVLLATFGVGRQAGWWIQSADEPADPEVQCDGNSPPAQIEPPNVQPADAAFTIDFDASPSGAYTEEDLVSEWNDPPWSNGVEEGRVIVVENSVPGDSDPENTVVANGETDKVLRVGYPEGEFGAKGSGTQWQRPTRDMEAAYVRYLVRFVGDFEFVRGGKLPGLAGGEANTGGSAPTGTDGWSARMMWREGGCAVFYLYHPDQPGEFGEDIGWGVAFERDRWHLVEHLVVMNEPGKNNGAMLGWLDGQLVADRRDIRFRDVDTLAIDMLYISTFFGGGSESWAPGTDQFIEFDQFEVAEIGAGTLEIWGVGPNG